MRFGTGTVIARKLGAREIIDPRTFAVGSIAETYATYLDDFLGRLSIPAPGCTKHGKVMAIAGGDAEC